MRHLALALVVFPLLLALAPTTLQAVPITGYAIGQVTANRSFYSSPFGGPRPIDFVVGDPVYVRFFYDPDWPESTKLVAFQLIVANALRWTTPAPNQTRIFEDEDTLLLDASGGPGFGVSMRLEGGAGTLAYGFDMGSNAEGFLARVTRVADDSAFPTPEPSGLVMGLIGVVGLGLAWNRKRSA
jgi:hypothetical protein